MTTEEAWALYEKYGSWRKAAAVAGVNHETLRRRARPEIRERNKARQRHRYHTDAAYRKRHNAARMERYWNLSVLEYARLRLMDRRRQALTRMAERNQRKEASG